MIIEYGKNIFEIQSMWEPYPNEIFSNAFEMEWLWFQLNARISPASLFSCTIRFELQSNRSKDKHKRIIKKTQSSSSNCKIVLDCNKRRVFVLNPLRFKWEAERWKKKHTTIVKERNFKFMHRVDYARGTFYSSLCMVLFLCCVFFFYFVPFRLDGYFFLIRFSCLPLFVR